MKYSVNKIKILVIKILIINNVVKTLLINLANLLLIIYKTIKIYL